MATTADDITVTELHQLEEILLDQLREGQARFDVDELVTVTTLTDTKIYEAMGYLARTHDYVTNVGAGTWEIELPEE